jgi:hypothetical protein
MTNDGIWEVCDRVTRPDEREEGVVLFPGDSQPWPQRLAKTPARLEQLSPEYHVAPQAHAAEVRHLEPRGCCTVDAVRNPSKIVPAGRRIVVRRLSVERCRQYAPRTGAQRGIVERGGMAIEPRSVGNGVIVDVRHERASRRTGTGVTSPTETLARLNDVASAGLPCQLLNLPLSRGVVDNDQLVARMFESCE